MQPGDNKPLSKQKNFYNLAKQTVIGSAPRKCPFGGEDKRYDEVYLSLLVKDNQGPGQINIRNCQDPQASFQPKKITSHSTSFSVSARPFGAPKHLINQPAPDQYYNERCEKFVHKKVNSKSFGKSHKNFDVKKYN